MDGMPATDVAGSGSGDRFSPEPDAAGGGANGGANGDVTVDQSSSSGPKGGEAGTGMTIGTGAIGEDGGVGHDGGAVGGDGGAAGDDGDDATDAGDRFCVASSDCAEGHFDKDIHSTADCPCPPQCQGAVYNQETIDRRAAQYEQHCASLGPMDGQGNLCPALFCVAPAPGVPTCVDMMCVRQP